MSAKKTGNRKASRSQEAAANRKRYKSWRDVVKEFPDYRRCQGCRKVYDAAGIVGFWEKNCPVCGRPLSDSVPTAR